MTLNCHCEETLLCTISELGKVFRCCCRKQSQLRVSKVEFLVEYWVFHLCRKFSFSSFNQQHLFEEMLGKMYFLNGWECFCQIQFTKNMIQYIFNYVLKGEMGALLMLADVWMGEENVENGYPFRIHKISDFWTWFNGTNLSQFTHSLNRALENLLNFSHASNLTSASECGDVRLIDYKWLKSFN